MSSYGKVSGRATSSSEARNFTAKLGNISPIQHYKTSNTASGMMATYNYDNSNTKHANDEANLHHTQPVGSKLVDLHTPRTIPTELDNNHRQYSPSAASSVDSSPPIVINRHLEQIVKCSLCHNKPVTPHLCPCCSKIVCLPCIKRWLVDQGKSNCPNCRASIHMNQMVNCKFVSEISTELEKLQSHIHSKKEKNLVSTPRHVVEQCSHHDLPLIYYCETCKVAICSDCAMFEDKHKSHSFKKVSEVYKECVEVVKSESNSVNTRLKDLNTLIINIEENIKMITKSKDETLKSINETVEEIRGNLETLYKTKLSSLVSQKNLIIDEITMLEQLNKELGKQIETSPQCVLIQKTPDIVRVVDEINKKPPISFSKISVEHSFPNELVPTFEGGQFRIENYFEKVKTTEVIYSDPININGLLWRLKIYPNGTGLAKGVFISVFLEMYKGLTEPKKYHYKVEMINRKDTTKNIERSFASIYECGECWGYNRFFRVSELISNGFVDPEEDVLILNFFVRPTSYFEKCLEQSRYIKELEDFKKSHLVSESLSSPVMNRELAPLSETPLTNKNDLEQNQSTGVQLQTWTDPSSTEDPNLSPIVETFSTPFITEDDVCVPSSVSPKLPKEELFTSQSVPQNTNELDHSNISLSSDEEDAPLPESAWKPVEPGFSIPHVGNQSQEEISTSQQQITPLDDQ
ncbi:hypothetical protein C9374_004492 [Naegleria lovaniensis]|uniref:Uncharacterized protein n=1 Tax=Naegleria lovaniensis TaxID=51637 RepID=A0AA88GMN1_NAELO|nr:uncharacterized protein C9374_004492 [Naegleria lovaniensis]KAG2383155.1 hypothetical protein C9374_004492 [Naegleria lovaniensis]